MNFRVLRGAQFGNWEAGGAMGVWAPGGWWDSCRRQTPIRASRASPTTVASLVGDGLQNAYVAESPLSMVQAWGVVLSLIGSMGLRGSRAGRGARRWAAGAGQKWRHGGMLRSPHIMRHRLVPRLCIVSTFRRLIINPERKKDVASFCIFSQADLGSNAFGALSRRSRFQFAADLICRSGRLPIKHPSHISTLSVLSWWFPCRPNCGQEMQCSCGASLPLLAAPASHLRGMAGVALSLGVGDAEWREGHLPTLSTVLVGESVVWASLQSIGRWWAAPVQTDSDITSAPRTSRLTHPPPTRPCRQLPSSAVLSTCTVAQDTR